MTRANRSGKRPVISRTALAIATAGTVLACVRRADAQVLERFSLHAEGGAAFLFGGEQATRFGPGGDVTARLAVRIVGPLHIQVSALNAWYTTQPPGGELGRLYAFEGGLRVAPIIRPGFVGGPFIDANAGLGVTGGLQRFTFDIGVGWLFRPVSFFGIGPAVRYVHIYQPDDQASPDDAHMLYAGIALSISAPASNGRTNDARRAPADTDRDGVPDDRDRCVSQPEDHDGFRDEDGCPDPDNDGDGFADANDRCPDQAETRNGFQDDDGCEDVAPVVVASAAPSANAQRIEEIGSHVLFETGSYRLQSESRSAIHEMCTYLNAHPEITRVRVEGHADERGSADLNQELSAYRAAAVARALVQCGVAPERLESAGLGATRRLCADGTENCNQRNRRVQFEVIERTPSTTPSGAPGEGAAAPGS
jgi:outer membrane protein OmpA-like peptidoglycan-associated protein